MCGTFPLPAIPPLPPHSTPPVPRSSAEPRSHCVPLLPPATGPPPPASRAMAPLIHPCVPSRASASATPGLALPRWAPALPVRALLERSPLPAAPCSRGSPPSTLQPWVLLPSIPHRSTPRLPMAQPPRSLPLWPPLQPAFRRFSLPRLFLWELAPPQSPPKQTAARQSCPQARALPPEKQYSPEPPQAEREPPPRPQPARWARLESRRHSRFQPALPP